MASELNVNTWTPNSTDNEIKITDAALLYIKKQMQKSGTGIGIRLGIKKSGCTGFAYVVEVIHERPKGDLLFNPAPEVIVAVEPKNYPYLQGMTLDYLREGVNGKLKFMNPNEKSSCGCGESFNFQDPVE